MQRYEHNKLYKDLAKRKKELKMMPLEWWNVFYEIKNLKKYNNKNAF